MSILNLIFILATFPIPHLLTIFFQSASELKTDFWQKETSSQYLFLICMLPVSLLGIATNL